jgi:hypothetical protein
VSATVESRERWLCKFLASLAAPTSVAVDDPCPRRHRFARWVQRRLAGANTPAVRAARNPARRPRRSLTRDELIDRIKAVAPQASSAHISAIAQWGDTAATSDDRMPILTPSFLFV